MPSLSLSLRETIRAGVSDRRDFPLAPSRAALLVIDVQKYCCDANRPGVPEYYGSEALPRMLGNVRDLLDAFRRKRDGPAECGADAKVDASVDGNADADAGGSDNASSRAISEERCATGCPEVIFVAIRSATNDGRDMGVDYKLSGPFFRDIPTVTSTLDEIFLPGSLKPDPSTGRGDIFVPKTACSAFATTNLDALLRNLFVEQLVVCGQLTDQCVESAVRDAADLGYLVTVAEDACAAHGREEHSKGLFGMKGFCRIVSTRQILREINGEE